MIAATESRQHEFPDDELTLDHVVAVLAVGPFDVVLAERLARRYFGPDTDGEYLAAAVDIFEAKVRERLSVTLRPAA